MTQKLGPQARRLLSGLESSSDETVSLLLRGTAPFTENELEILRRDGAQIRTTAGDVVSADVPVKAVRAVTDHEFVVNAELSQPLFYEKPAASVFGCGVTGLRTKDEGLSWNTTQTETPRSRRACRRPSRCRLPRR